MKDYTQAMRDLEVSVAKLEQRLKWNERLTFWCSLVGTIIGSVVGIALSRL